MALRAFAACAAVCVGLFVAGCAAPDHEPGADRADAGSTPEGEPRAGSASGSASASGDTVGAPTPASGSSGVHDLRGRYPDLPDMGDTREYFRAHGSRTLVDRGYFRGDLQLAGAGLKKEGAGPDESVIDGHLEVRGDGWVLTGLTITGDVVVRGEGNDLSGCQVLGRVDARGSRNVLPRR